jgi:glycosyltransferase involved in cell wall biosynthesis
MKGISAIVATYKRKDELVRLFDSIISNNVPELEVIVVDQNTDGLIDGVISDYSRKLDIQHIKMTEANQSKARNLGAAKARYPVICFPDDDCWFETDSLKKVQQFFNEKPSTDILVINWKQNPVVHTSSFNLTRKDVFSFKAVGYVTYVLFLNAGVFNKLGGFMETIGIGKYIGGGEDSELTFRAAQRNFNIFYRSDIIVNHKYIPILSRDLTTIRARQRAMGFMYAKYQVPKHVIVKGLAAPLFKMIVSIGKRRSKEYYNMFLGRTEGFLYGMKNRQQRTPEPSGLQSNISIGI